MRAAEPSSTIEAGVVRLRELLLAAPDGERIGSEEDMLKLVGVSRATLRQVARLLEREGCLRVKRGGSGGYFAARPNLDRVTSTVSSYLESLQIETEDVTALSSALWVEAVRRAALSSSERSRAKYRRCIKELDRIPDDAPFLAIASFEEATHRLMFELIGGRFIELIFQISIRFTQARGYPAEVAKRDDTQAHHRFVSAWRVEKRLELEAIARGDVEMAVLAARRMRTVWHERIWGHAAPSEAAARADDRIARKIAR